MTTHDEPISVVTLLDQQIAIVLKKSDSKTRPKASAKKENLKKPLKSSLFHHRPLSRFFKGVFLLFGNGSRVLADAHDLVNLLICSICNFVQY